MDHCVGVGVVRSVANRCVGMVRWFGSSVGSIVTTPGCSINILCVCVCIYIYNVESKLQQILMLHF
jgi:hypothetical protein